MGDVGVEVYLLIAHVEVMSLNDKRRGKGGERERESRTNYWGTSTFRGGEELVGIV